MFLKSKGKNIHKRSKTVKLEKTHTDNGDIKSVTVRHPQTASNLLKRITQSKIITQELETEEKTKHFGRKISYYSTLKNCYQIIKVHEKPKVITQEPNKTKVYAESNAAGRTLQLDLIKPIHDGPFRGCSRI